ncbi:MAG: adenosylcobinamide-GDP ribazoletransferase [Candidatus Omnitrophica bacterium]|nr:adenosylcobinamide-GDP ribazoletransferase [Candidatus Omnitrophota bacterium]
MRKFLAALQFLTIFPVRINEMKEEELGESMAFFPVIGLLIGISTAILNYFLSHLMSENLVNIFLIIWIVIVTGGLHLDGFADTCDGIFSWRSDKNEILKIMRDSRIGTMGVLGIFSLLLLKYELLSNIPGREKYIALIIMPVFGRFSQTVSAFTLPYARETSGAASFIRHLNIKTIIFSSILFLVITTPVWFPKVFLIDLVSLIILVPLLLFFSKKLGGVTGDVLGAINEVVEIIVLVVIYLAK